MKQTTVLFLASLIAGCAQASTINLYSSAATTTNNSGQPTLNINPHPSWAAALPGSYWVSDGITGNPSDAGYTVLPNGTTVLFSQNFFLDGAVTAASLSILADDTTSVVLNGTTIFAAAELPAGGYPNCSAQTIGCLTSTRADLTLANLSPYLKLGNNTISFGVEQKNYVSFGLDYAGSIATTVPEPGSLALIGSGLMFVGLVSRRKRLNLAGSHRA